MNAKLFFKKIFRTLLVAGIAMILLSATNALAASGTLDPTFGSNGIVTARSSSASEVVLQPDGKIITLGTIKLSDTQSKRTITRYNSNGTVDNTFGVNGNTFVEVESFSASKIALQPGGKLIVGGKSGEAFAVVRYNSNGTLDTSFGTNGMGVFLGASDGYQSLGDIAIQSDGKIVVVGDTSGSQSTRTDLIFARFNSDGTKDIGDIIYFSNSHNNYGKGVAIQPDGKIILSGIITPDDGRGPLLSLARINQDGSLDKSTFGTDGKVAIPFYDFDNNHSALALQPDGKIVLTGTVFNNGGIEGNLAVARFNSNGALDTTFGGTGTLITDFGADESIYDLVIQSDGKIMLGGKTCDLCTNYGSSDFLLARYNSDGSLDTTFGTNGKVVTDFGNNIETARSIVLQPDSKVLAVGTSGENAILARYDVSASNTTQSTLTFNSVDANDGWILESGENSNQGGSLDKTAKVVFVGDDAKDRQYRSILSFNTISIPDNALITSAQVKIKRQTEVGTDPFTTHGDLLLDIRSGTFSNNINLTAEDFSAIASIGSNQEKFFDSTLKWYTANLSNINLGFLNKFGVTQFRLLFSKDDNDDMGDDYIKFFSSASAVSDQPQLIVTYSTTSGGGTGNRAPVINGGAAISISIPENTTIVTAVTAVDPDGQPITYSISGLDADKFSISPSTGLLTFVTAPDMEAIPLDTVYHLKAQASDGNLTASQDIAVSVTGVNELAPVITSDGGGEVAYISLPENTMDVTTITATDADLPTQSLKYWTAGGADVLLFNLDWRDGKLSFMTAPSYNTPNDADSDHVYHITVKVFDGKFNTLQELVISITNPNPPPVSMLDSTFGTNGVVTTKINGLPSSASAVVLQPDGKTITLGGVQSKKAITRYNSNGTLDTSFGTNGSTLIEVTPFSGSEIALQPDGKLVVAGISQRGFAVVRYNSNGTLDTSFGTNGMGAIGASIDDENSVEDVTVQPDGKIVVIGSYHFNPGNHTDFQIVRFNSDGTRDVIDTIYLSYRQFDYGKAVVIQPDNKIVISGDMQGYDGEYYIALARQNSNVRPDGSTFGTNGNVVTPLDNFKNSSGALALQPDGKIIVAGTIFNGDLNVPQNIALARFNSDGSLDTTFGGTGIVVTDFGANESADDLVIQASGKIILAGTTSNQGSSDFLLVRYNSDGSLDTSFGSNGKMVTDFGNSAETATGIVQQSDGKVIVSGTSGDNAILARYNTGASIATNTLTFNSVGGNDGWILELGENTNKGGTLDKISNVFFVGDDARDRQYRSILSFDTVSIPDNAAITSAQIKIKKQGIVGTDPFNTHGNLLMEIRNGTFSNSVALNVEDFSAIVGTGATQDKFSVADASWYTASLSNINLSLVNKVGVTQFRLLFSKDDNDNMSADYAKFFSGNSATDLPQLIVTYGSGGTANQAPVINGGASLSISIPENTMTVAGVTAMDPDGQSITYSISGVDAGKFSINPSTGILAFLTAPDFEAIPSGTIYHVTAQASDGSQTSTQDISVTVTPVNEFAPVVTSSTNISIPENTIDVTTITVTDSDLPTSIEYVFAGGADDFLFTVDQTTGKLSFVTAPSYNAPNDAGLDHVYNVKFEIQDGEYATPLELVISITAPNTSTNEMLDPTFGTNGAATTKFNGLPSSIRDIVLQADGKIVVLGNNQSSKIIARYDNNGSLDNTFGSNGITSIDFPSFFVKKLALQPDGKLIVAGQQRGFAAVRYNSNGSLDTSFGANGLAALDPVNTNSDIYYFVEDVTIQPDGKIVMAGSYSIGNHIEIEVVRFNSDGTRDVIESMDWGTFGSQYNYGKAVTIQPDNKIVVSGDMVSCCDTYQYISLARLDPNVRLDRSTFGSGRGAVTARLNHFQHSSGALALQPDGRIIVAGTILGTDWKTPQNMAMARFNTDGSLDITFGGTGIVVTDFGAEESTANLVIQASGKIIVAGTTSSAGSSDFLLVRYNSDGSLDTSFGTNGKLTTDFGNSAESASGIVQQPDGKVIVSGTSGDNAILARYDTGLPVTATTLTFKSVGGNDGWILESGENTGQGGTLDKISNVLFIGDDAKDRQYRGILSFDTNSIPDNVTITSAQIKIKKQTIVGADPFTTHGNLQIEIRKGPFSNDIGLTLADFSAIADSSSTLDTFAAADSNWYTASLSNVNLGLINKYGASQFRLLFSKDDNDDMDADYIKFFSGNAASDQPQLIITYSTVGSGTGNQAPVINGGATLSVSTPENTTLVSGVTAVDFDGQSITYSISGADARLFSITPTGVLSFVTPPDFEAIPSGTVYHVTAQASDGSLTATQDIAVTVTPLNEFAPVITSSGGTDISLPENTLDVTTITTTDADLSNPSINYLIGGLDQQLFKLDAATGKLSFITPPSYSAPNDWELDHVYNININADDGRFSVWLEIAITIINPNSATGLTAPRPVGNQADNKHNIYAPIVTSGNEISVSENKMAVTTVVATDADVPVQPLTYSITGGADSTLFNINSSTGDLAFVAAPNYEIPTDAGLDNIYNITIEASDGELTVTQDVVVTVTPVSDNNPVITSNAAVSISENTTAVTTVAATDADLPTQPLAFSISGGADSALFNINSSTGQLTFIAAPDYESPADAGLDNIYNIAIEASDGELTATQDVVVTVTPVSDNNPVITSNAAVSISENSTAVTTVAATDADLPTQPLAFSVSGGADSTLFNINSSTGELTFIAAPDYEIPADAGLDNIYNVTIQASDGVLTGTQDIAVTITAVNDNNPVITSNGPSAIPENTLAVTTLTATDADLPTQPLTYSIVGGADSTLFGVNPSTGELTFITAPDFESPTDAGIDNIYNVTVQVSDGELVSTQDIAVTVNAVNDNTPVITSTGNLSIPENNTAAATVTATDVDLPTQPLTYSIVGGADSTLFGVNPSTGELTFVTALDYEMQKDAGMDNIYNVTVQASDGALAVPQDISVTVTPVNDNIPVITSPASLPISENTTAVVVITATDADLPAQALTYSILGGADSALLTINTSTGVLDFITGRDYEMPGDAGSDNIYNVTVQASDGALNVTQDIAISIAPVNDNTPVITSQNNYSIPENTSTITTIPATDTDRPAQPLTYSISGGADATKFSILGNTGVLTFITAPDFETPADFNLDNIYEVVVQVSDGTHNSTQSIAIGVVDVE